MFLLESLAIAGSFLEEKNQEAAFLNKLQRGYTVVFER